MGLNDVSTQLHPVRVSRPRLHPLLSAGGAESLVVVSSPAGTGKTFAVAEWVRGLPGDVVWARATAARERSAWAALLGCLKSHGLRMEGPHDRPGHARLLKLAARVSERPQPLTVVLDGFDVVEAAVTAQIDLLVHHAHGRLRVVLVSRVAPVLPVGTHRSAVVVGQADLAFTDGEARELLSGLGLELEPSAVRRLNHVVGGWPVALHMAGRVLLSRPHDTLSVESAVRRAGGISDYVLSEVVDTQAPDVRRFLLATSALPELTPATVERVSGPRGVQILAGLHRLNVLLQQTERAECYRYPPFFVELLRSQLGYESRILDTPGAGPSVPQQRPATSRRTGGVLRIPAPGGSDDLLLVETLTPKEIEVLGHLQELLTTEEIGQTMFVSVNTVRTHIRNILRKLGVTRRYAAVRRARELGLVPVNR